MRAIILLGVLVIACAESFAQPCQEIKGIIRDEQGQSLTGANLYLKSNWRTGTSSDSVGGFLLPIQANDTLVVSFIGFAEQVVPVSPATCVLVITLQSISTQTDAVTVSAARLISEEFRTFKATKLQIYTNPAARADPLLAVNAMPAATTLDESANISLRGSTAQETGVFFNDVPIYDGVRYSQLNGIGTFSIFNTAIIDNVQVFPGNPPLEYGNVSSGLIALQTDTEVPDQSTTQLSFTLANIGVNAQVRSGKTSSLTFFSNYQFPSALRALNRKAFDRIKKFNTADLGLHYYRHWPTTRLRIFNYSVRESFVYDFRHPSFRGDFRAGKTRNFSTISLNQKVGGGELSLNQGMSFGRSTFGYSATDIHLVSRDFYTSVNYYYQTPVIEFKTGFSSDTRRQAFDGSSAVLPYALGPQHPHRRATTTTRIPLVEAYGYTKIILAEKLIAGAGVRKNFNRRSAPDYTSLQVNFKWQPNENFAAILGGGKYHRTDFTRGGENPLIHYEQEQLSIDLNYSKKSYEFSLSGFAKRSDQGNEKQSTQGLEFFAVYRTARFTGQASFTTLRATLEQGNNQLKPAPFDLGYFVKSNVQYRVNQHWTISLFATARQGSWYAPVVGAQFDSQWQVFQPFYSETMVKRLPAYLSVSGNINRVFSLADNLNLIAFVSAENITNHLNVRAYGYNFDYSQKVMERFTQRTFFVGCILNF